MPPAAVIATRVARPTAPRSQASRFDAQAPFRAKTKLMEAIALARKIRPGAAIGANLSDIRDRLGYHVDFVDKGMVVMFALRPSSMLNRRERNFGRLIVMGDGSFATSGFGFSRPRRPPNGYQGLLS